MLNSAASDLKTRGGEGRRRGEKRESKAAQLRVIRSESSISKDKHALETLPKTMANCSGDRHNQQRHLDDPNLYRKIARNSIPLRRR